MTLKTNLKKLAPRSLYYRFLLIAIVPILLVLAVATYMFYERHWKSINRNLSSVLVGEVALITREFEHSAPEEREIIFQTAKEFLNFSVRFEEDDVLPEYRVAHQEYAVFQEALSGNLTYPFIVRKLDNMEDLEILVQFSKELMVPDGVLSIIVPVKRLENPTTYIFIMWIVGAALVFMVVSISFLNNQVRSIVRLTVAAEKFGKGQDLPNFRPQGAKEIRRAGLAFIEMRERIKRLITRRTQMLAGVSHDLRTPLTRMRLQVAMLKDKKSAEELKADIDEMEKMLNGYLEFVREETGGGIAEKTENINLHKFIEGIIESYRNYPGKKEIDIAPDINIKVRPDSFRRCITNFVDNSLRYGSHIKISAEELDSEISIIIEDNGPGIPEDKWEEVFQPFYRIEESRNKETGGVGLGMSIARDIILSHGGEIYLNNSKLGGLKIKILLPR